MAKYGPWVVDRFGFVGLTRFCHTLHIRSKTKCKNQWLNVNFYRIKDFGSFDKQKLNDESWKIALGAV